MKVTNSISFLSIRFCAYSQGNWHRIMHHHHAIHFGTVSYLPIAVIVLRVFNSDLAWEFKFRIVKSSKNIILTQYLVFEKIKYIQL